MKQIVIKVYHDEDLSNILHEIVSALDYDNYEYDCEIQDEQVKE